MAGARSARERLRGLHVLADHDPRWKHDAIAQARAACAAGAAAVQLRAKQASDREVLRLAASLRALTRASQVLFLVNDRFDLALAAGADGVHLGQEDVPPGRIPPSLRSRLLVGRSTHSLEEVQRARGEGVDYLAFGPVFGTTSKAVASGPQGLQALSRAVRAAEPLPVVAIGGIHAERIPALRAEGIAGVAVISAVAGASDPEAASRLLVEALQSDGSP